MKLMTQAIRKKLPKLYSTEKTSDPIVHVKFFTPWTNWTWYATEFDGTDTFFGLVCGHENELGYFSLKELQQIRGPFGLKIERDMYFRPKPLSEVQRLHGERGAANPTNPYRPFRGRCVAGVGPVVNESHGIKYTKDRCSRLATYIAGGRWPLCTQHMHQWKRLGYKGTIRKI